MDSYSKRKNIILLIFLLVGVAFILKLFSLQVINSTYKRTATKNVLREVVEYPSRGLIYDRNGKLMVYNQASYDLMATPREIGVFDTLGLCQMLEVSVGNLRDELRRAKKYSRYKPSIVVKQISPERYALLQEKMYKYPGFFFITRTLRTYGFSSAAHVLGYVGEVNQNALDKDQYYRSGDYVGITGIEKAYEKELRGDKGAKFFLVDVHNRVKGTYDKGRLDTTAVKGIDLISTIDIVLQQYGELLMQNKAGSIVAIEPSTGEILALVSTPGYLPEELVGRKRMENYPKLATDSLLPLYNRAIRAQYPPGSTFKMLHALIALQENVINPSTRFTCSFGYHAGSFTQKCHHNQSFDLTGSIAESCNAYYAYTFRRILENPALGGVKNGYEKWRNYAKSFGFTAKVCPEFDEELKGYIPESDYYQKKVFPYSKWRALPLISLAIGQGEIQATPMQMANYTAALANHGFYYSPHVVKEIGHGGTREEWLEKHYTLVDTVQFEKIMDGMENVMSHTYPGTAANASVSGIRICGKTGTAENPHGPDHSTFIAFAPRNHPKIAIAVYVENGRWGNLYAAPIATLMIEKYLNGEIQASSKWSETKMLTTNLLYPDQPNYVKYYK
ncbi:MAG: penicillin-binding protein 2 [Prolixibacteraceae bacterium]